MDPKIFKAYDIRGVYPQELNEDAAYQIGLAFARFAGASARRVKYSKANPIRNRISNGARNIVVGEDGRTSSPALREALVRALRDAGANVISAGVCTTPLFYFAVASTRGADAGIMVTASHNPGKYNGFKLVRGDAMPIEPKAIIPQIKKIKSPSSILPLGKGEEGGGRGKITKINAIDAYIKKVLSLVDVKKIKPAKIVIDAGNGTAGITAAKLLSRLPQIKAQKLFFDIDMSFPNHEANPSKEETLETLKAAVTKTGAALGVAYDGDADRVGFVDEAGRTMRADIVFAALLPELLSGRQKNAVLYDLRCSKIVPETAKNLGGKTQMTRVGHAFIKKQLRKTGAVAAAELSSHFYFQDFYGVECSDLVMLYLLAEMSRRGKPASEITAPLQKYFHSGEINFEVKDKDEKIAAILKKYSRQAKKISRLDGLRMDFEAFECHSRHSHRDYWWWFNVRASNTEPLLRLNVEANNHELLNEKLSEITNLING